MGEGSVTIHSECTVAVQSNLPTSCFVLQQYIHYEFGSGQGTLHLLNLELPLAFVVLLVSIDHRFHTYYFQSPMHTA